jgi:hypothetical protein
MGRKKNDAKSLIFKLTITSVITWLIFEVYRLRNTYVKNKASFGIFSIKSRLYIYFVTDISSGRMAGQYDNWC